jgi:DNA (cytosine-5)-methyltransferase 1
LGTWEAIAGAGLQPTPLAAIDIDSEALQIYARNLAPRMAMLRNANSVVDFQVNGRGEEARFAYEPVIIDRQLGQFINKVDLFLAGPPCQGNSNLNNHTRREDPRNLLYLGAAAIGVALHAKGMIIENVPDVVKDRQGVVENTKSVLRNAGYEITTGILNAQELGCAQTRRRHFLIACQRPFIHQLDEVAECMKKPSVDVRWAIGDLVDVVDETYFDSASIISRDNIKRIDFLFDNDLYELPDAERPVCHQDGHTYPSVYGRLRWNLPAGTITTGFQTPGRGRYIHPSKRRVLTPHEAARLQGFPDFFVFEADAKPSRAALSKWIGDAVPPMLGYVTATCALSGLSEFHDTTK